MTLSSRDPSTPPAPYSPPSGPGRRFGLWRDVDVTGISGTGRVAVGCLFPNGWVALTWLTEHTSLVMYPSMNDVQYIHGHGGRTRIVWVDPT